MPAEIRHLLPNSEPGDTTWQKVLRVKKRNEVYYAAEYGMVKKRTCHTILFRDDDGSMITASVLYYIHNVRFILCSQTAGLVFFKKSYIVTFSQALFIHNLSYN